MGYGFNIFTGKLDNTDKARDNAHDGPLIHKEVVEKIRDKVECMI